MFSNVVFLALVGFVSAAVADQVVYQQPETSSFVYNSNYNGLNADNFPAVGVRFGYNNAQYTPSSGSYLRYASSSAYEPFTSSKSYYKPSTGSSEAYYFKSDDYSSNRPVVRAYGLSDDSSRSVYGKQYYTANYRSGAGYAPSYYSTPVAPLAYNKQYYESAPLYQQQYYPGASGTFGSYYSGSASRPSFYSYGGTGSPYSFSNTYSSNRQYNQQVPFSNTGYYGGSRQFYSAATPFYSSGSSYYGVSPSSNYGITYGY